MEVLQHEEEDVYAPVVKAGSDEKNIFTCVVRKTDNDFMAFTQHRGKVFVVEKIPSFNLMSIKYLLPMVGGKIDGYYDVVRIGFTEKDGKPALRLRLGEYHSLGDKWVHIYGDGFQQLLLAGAGDARNAQNFAAHGGKGDVVEAFDAVLVHAGQVFDLEDRMGVDRIGAVWSVSWPTA